MTSTTLADFLTDCAEALGNVRESDSAPLAMTTAEVLAGIRELREDIVWHEQQDAAAKAALANRDEAMLQRFAARLNKRQRLTVFEGEPRLCVSVGAAFCELAVALQEPAT